MNNVPTRFTLLFCATDAGGARNLAPIAALAKANGHPTHVLSSTTTMPLFAEIGVAARLAEIANECDARALLGTLRPHAIICGTTRYVEAEAHLIAAAAALGIASLSVLDEWYGYRGRFAASDDSLRWLPDIVCCPDELAAAEAAAEGLPPDRLRATGSPALAALTDRVAAFAAHPPEIPEQWADTDGGQRLLFLSETHAADYGSAPGEVGPLGPYIGYTEHVVRRHLARTLTRLGHACRVVEKLHPSADEPSLPPADAPQPWHIVRRAPLWSFLYHADLIVGMRSMALLEAALMGRRPLAYQPGLIGPQRCTAVRLDLADSAGDEESLARWLSASGIGLRQPPRPAFAAANAAENILHMALGL